MEYINKKFDTARHAVSNLQKGVSRFNAILKMRKQDEEEYLERRDSLIKRFELAFDATWKYLKIYLEVKEGIVQNFPKNCF